MSRPLSRRAQERLLEAAAPLAGDPVAGAVDAGRYELRGELGRGGMGVVHEAWDTELGRPVALKLLSRPAALSDAARARFLREARAAARLAHPNIATVYDATPDAIAMQLVRGATLEERPWADTAGLVGLLRDAALAIHHAHEQGVVHRDLKPANIMVEPGADDRTRVYVMDFGLAKEREVDSSLSRSGMIVGTPAFMAPEQAAGRDAEVGPATDVHGLGATLFACLAGRPPFGELPREGASAGGLFELLRRITEEEAPSLRRVAPGTDKDLALLVGKCLAKEPERRYASALSLAADMDRWLRGEPIEARPPTVAYRVRRFVSRRQGALAVAAGAALLAVLVGLPFLLSETRRRELAERVFSLSQGVHQALRDAETTRDSGVGHEREAWEVLEGAVQRCRAFLADEEVATVRTFLGRLLREQGRYDEALVEFDRAAESRAGIPGLELERGLALAALYRERVPVLGEAPPPELEAWRTRALADLDAALADAPVAPPPSWVFAEGQRAWMAGALEDAVERQREVVERDPGHREAHLSLGRLYLLTGRDDLAMRHTVIASDLVRGHRPAYLARGDVSIGTDGNVLDPRRELVSMEGLRELLLDFQLLLQLEGGDANVLGLRGQVQLRRAVREVTALELEDARASLARAVSEFDGALLLDERLVGARLARAVTRLHLARLLARAGEPEEASRALALAMTDYDAVCRAEPELAVAWYDRALAHEWRGQLASLGRRAEEAREAREASAADARRALALCADDHPWRWRFAVLADEG